MNPTIQDALNTVDRLEPVDKELFFELFQKRLIEQRRKRIRNNADETFKAIENGTIKKGNLNDLLADLEF